MSECVQLNIKDQTAFVRLNRPEVHNALNEDVMKSLTQYFHELDHSRDVRAIVIHSEGKHFCAGADIHWMSRTVDYSHEENIADAKVLSGMLHAVRACSKPVIARVQGAAYGGAVGLVSACDMCVAVEGARFCLSETRLGIVAAVISPFVLEKIGTAARRFALTAEVFDGLHAQRLGLVNEVAQSLEAADQWIDSIVANIRKGGPLAVAACKRALLDVAHMPWEQTEDYTARIIAQIRVSPEGQEGLHAFLEKRSPNWIRE